jgi:phosphoglycolate phosphatase
MVLIFDLDGTLLNTIDDLGYACNHALQLAGYPVHPIKAYPAMVGNGISNLIRRALPEAVRTEETILLVREFFVPYYDEHNCDFTRPYSGIPELLATLKAQGHLLAVASNKYQAATEKIVNHFFPGIFDVIFGEREGVNRKPDPQIVCDILNTLNPPYGEADRSNVGRKELSTLNDSQPSTLNAQLIYIGDSLVDRDTARNAGLPFVACSWGFVPRETLVAEGVEHIIDQPVDLLNYVH